MNNSLDFLPLRFDERTRPFPSRSDIVEIRLGLGQVQQMLGTGETRRVRWQIQFTLIVLTLERFFLMMIE